MITDEQPQAVENDFAAFEAAANATEPQSKEAQPKEEAAPVADPKAADAPVEDVEASEDEQTDEDQPEGEEQPKKRRSKPASERIAEVTAKWREAERRLQELEAKVTGNDAAPEPTKPDPSAFEFGGGRRWSEHSGGR